jgi:hypothetical protein
MKPGIFTATVRNHFWSRSRSGTEFLGVQFDVPSDFNDVESITAQIWFTSKAMGMARSQLKALGFNCDTQDLAELGGSISLVGAETDIELQEHEYNGRYELRVVRIGVSKPPDAARLKELGASLRAAKKSVAKVEELPPVGGMSPAEAANEVGAPRPAEDIPF